MVVVVPVVVFGLPGESQQGRPADSRLGCERRHAHGGRSWKPFVTTPSAFLQDYFILLDVREQNRKLKADNDKLRMDNIYFRNQLATAEHARALTVFQAQTPSKTIAARVIGNSTVATAKAVFIDRGSTSGIQKGMAVVTPEGIVGKVIAVYPLVSQVLLVTDATFKVGIESQKNHVHGILNCGSGHCIVEQVQDEDKLDARRMVFHFRRRSDFSARLSSRYRRFKPTRATGAGHAGCEAEL